MESALATISISCIFFCACTYTPLSKIPSVSVCMLQSVCTWVCTASYLMLSEYQVLSLCVPSLFKLFLVWVSDFCHFFSFVRLIDSYTRHFDIICLYFSSLSSRSLFHRFLFFFFLSPFSFLWCSSKELSFPLFWVFFDLSFDLICSVFILSLLLVSLFQSFSWDAVIL